MPKKIMEIFGNWLHTQIHFVLYIRWTFWGSGIEYWGLGIESPPPILIHRKYIFRGCVDWSLTHALFLPQCHEVEIQYCCHVTIQLHVDPKSLLRSKINLSSSLFSQIFCYTDENWVMQHHTSCVGSSESVATLWGGTMPVAFWPHLYFLVSRPKIPEELIRFSWTH